MAATITNPGNVVTEARFQEALKWTRGTGYYGAHKHKRPLMFRSFRQSFTDDATMVKAKYITYLLSWVLHHGKELQPSDVSENAGEEILAEVHRKVAEERAR